MSMCQSTTIQLGLIPRPSGPGTASNSREYHVFVCNFFQHFPNSNFRVLLKTRNEITICDIYWTLNFSTISWCNFTNV